MSDSLRCLKCKGLLVLEEFEDETCIKCVNCSKRIYPTFVPKESRPFTSNYKVGSRERAYFPKEYSDVL